MKKLTSYQKIKVKKLAEKGLHAIEIAERIGLTGHEIYCSGDFCIAFSKGYKVQS